MSHKPSIICVDDEKVILTALKEQIKLKFGNTIDVILAQSGFEAIECFTGLVKQKRMVPLVICDYIMPDMKGDAVLSHIRKQDSSVKLVLLTGQASLEGIKSAVNNAIIHKIIIKPWQQDFMYSVIEEAIENYTASIQPSEYIEPYIITDKVRQSLESIKNGICIFEALKESAGSDDNDAMKSYIESFDAYFFNISKSLDSLIESIKTPAYTKLSDKRTSVKNNLSDKQNPIADSLNELSIRVTELEKAYNKIPKKIAAWDNEKILLFNIEDVLFFSSEGRTIAANTKSGKYRIKGTISQLESDLNEYSFFRCHKSYLVNLNHVSKIYPWLGYDSYMSTIEGCDMEIPISRNYVKEMKRLLGI